MSRAVKQAKRAFFGAMKWSGGYRILQNSRWRRQKLLILAYHGISVNDEHEWDPALFMPQSLFRERMEALRAAECNVLPLQASVTRLYSGDLPPRSVVLTFDDGLRDFLLKALPVLEEYGYPATVYLTTYYSIRRYPVFNVFIRYLLWKARNRRVDLTGVVPGLKVVSLASNKEREKIWGFIAQHIRERHMPNDAQLELTRCISEHAGVDFDRLFASGVLQIMSPAEVAEASRRGVAIGLHTHRHRAPGEEADFRREIRENRENIVRMCSGGALEHFCYPSGVCKPEFFPWLKAEGVQTATTCRSGLAARDISPFELPRLIDTCNISALEFEAWVSGVAHLLPRRT